MWVKKIIRHGNSLAVVIPADLCRDLIINRGDFVAMNLSPEAVIQIKPISKEIAKSLEEKDVK